MRDGFWVWDFSVEGAERKLSPLPSYSLSSSLDMLDSHIDNSVNHLTRIDTITFMRARTWKVVEWSREDEWAGEQVPFECEHCGREAFCPVLDDIHKARPIAGGGMGLVFDFSPKLAGPGCLPEVIECRKCRRQYSNWGSMVSAGKEVSGVL